MADGRRLVTGEIHWPGLKRERRLDRAEHQLCGVGCQCGERDDFSKLCWFSHGLFLAKTDSEWNSPVLYIVSVPWYRYPRSFSHSLR